MRWMMLLVLALAGLAGVAAEVTAEQVRAMVADVDPAVPATAALVEERLVALGPAAAGLVCDEADRLATARAAAEAAGDVAAAQRLNLQAVTADRAAVRLAVGFNPPERIVAWVKAHVEGDTAPFVLDAATPVRVIDPALERAYLDFLVYLVRFRQYPVARVLPAPLAGNNLFLVRRAPAEGSKNIEPEVTLVTDPEGLKAFFLKYAKPVIKPNIRMTQEGVYSGLRSYVASWLRLSTELHNDGMFRFTIAPEGLKVAKDPQGGYLVTGRAEVVPSGGNAGSITAVGRFDGGTRLVEITETVKLRAGMRPICQATKLLDPDPLVRRMAEQDLLVMGPACYPYLQERRAQAPPALQAAIDALWARIVARELGWTREGEL